MSNNIRVRFAPSPTGYLHIGNARTALFNYLFVKKNNGSFILRIEDTDFVRVKKEYEEGIIADIEWLGLDWDEGPDCGGSYGPYRQSERLDIYKDYADRLLKGGKAYKCFCSGDELERKRKELLSKRLPPRYDGRCRNLSREDAANYKQNGIKPSIRFMVEDGTIEFDDMVRGKMTFKGSDMGDFVILRSDGVSAYNFAAVVDDALMKITHVIRGEDHLSNTPRQILLNQAMGFDSPRFAHLSMILGPDKSRLSKRHGAESVAEFREEGYLPEAVINYLSLLGWSNPPHPPFAKGGGGGIGEIMPLPDIIKNFSIERVSKSPAVFDIKKLRWINSAYIRNKDIAELTELSLPFFTKAGVRIETVDRQWLHKVVDAIRGNIETLSEIDKYAGIFFDDNIIHPIPPLAKDGEAVEVLKLLKERVEAEERITEDTADKILSDIKEKINLKGKKLMMPIRIALTGRTDGPELKKIIDVLGKERIIKRIESAQKSIANT
ncbi:MAG: glutamate--tRNA ligase [Nitrospinae bacterium]|nr:glutamate--tRNA ligase [Nitrospinota bacterium]MBI3815779.1 glutamate--tRNA ligase [Nitrospinota bacterium]